MIDIIRKLNGLPIDIRYYNKNFKHLQPGFYVMEKNQFSPKKIIYVLPKKFKKRYNKSKRFNKRQNDITTKYFKSILEGDIK